MLADAAEFAKQLRTCEREIQNVKAATEGTSPSIATAGQGWLATDLPNTRCT